MFNLGFVATMSRKKIRGENVICPLSGDFTKLWSRFFNVITALFLKYFRGRFGSFIFLPYLCTRKTQELHFRVKIHRGVEQLVSLPGS